ncbi:MAG: pyruvate, water dikinase regulatory protein [Pikeienuella sp.]
MTLYTISDSTGETAAKIAAAAMSFFPKVGDKTKHRVFVTDLEKAKAVLAKIASDPGPVIVTMADDELRDWIIEGVQKLGLPVTTPVAPVVEMLEDYFGQPARARPGGQYHVDDLYFRRVDAIDFAISQDDGAGRLAAADVILTGVSRTSKTPTCIYLACRGIRAANIPLVPGISPSVALFEAAEKGVPIVGLTASPNRLAQIRGARLESIGEDRTADYAALDQIRSEVAEARLLFERLSASVIDVTRRSIEETAAAITALLEERARP